MDSRAHNRIAWDALVEQGDRWTRPVGPDAIERARRGAFDLLLTPTKPVPLAWFPDLKGTATLCLASGGGQQGPLLAAAGASVTVFDNSPRQLAQDRFVAERDHLALNTIEGDMADLSDFANESFELIVHPVSNCFVPDVRRVWRECFRVLHPGGILLAGFNNPVRYLFDDASAQRGKLEVRHPIPYSDLAPTSDAVPSATAPAVMRPLEFGHTLTDQIAGQLDAGFLLTAFFEDGYGPSSDDDPISRYLETFIATRAVKRPNEANH